MGKQRVMWEEPSMSYRLERRLSLWVVDDSATDAERVRRLFADRHDVVVFSDGAAALERLVTGPAPDLFLLDWMMPGMSGIEVCEYIRGSKKSHSQVPIILLTSRRGVEEVTKAFACGANDYVAKPFVDEELRARVESQLRAKALLVRAEEAEADVRSLLANAPDPIFAVDSQGIITFVNDEGERILKRTRAQIIGAPFSTLVTGLGFMHLGVGPGEPFLPIPDVKIDGRIFSPSVRVLPSDSAATTTVALRDVTTRRQTETRRLDFYSVIAHDLRTPITSILLRLEMTFRGKHGVLPAGHLLDLRKVEASLRSLVGMINDFLELARLEGVGYKIDRDPFDLSALVQETMEDFLPLLEKSELVWKQRGLDRKAVVSGDRQRLSQVVANLIGNAIKFTPAPGSVTTTVVVSDDHVEVSVEDTGRGIAADEIKDVFERYARSREVTRETAGTGLGLMIVREIVEAHGGVIGAESQVGKGSRFWFQLPRHV